MRIKVTQEHIDKGVRKDSQKCPIGLAIREAGLASPICPASRIISGLEEGTKFWQDFDAGAPVKPFEFEVSV